MLRVCYFGTYEAGYSRNKIIIEGLRKNGVLVSECNYPLWQGKEHKSARGVWSKIVFGFNLLRAYCVLGYKYFKIKEKIIIVGYPGQFDAVFAGLLGRLRKKTLIFDAYLSLYDSLIADRGMVSTRSLTARLLFWVDRHSCLAADKVLLDTNKHIDYFCSTFGLGSKKFRRVWIGANDGVFFPNDKKKHKKFTAVFHGKFIPLQGVEYIVESAKYLKEENINLIIIGAGQVRKKIMARAKDLGLDNVRFLDFMPYDQLREELSKCHVGLGVFGNTDKARRVIPNKAYEILALKIPLVTGDSLAVREGLNPDDDCAICRMADSRAIAEAVIALKKNPKKRELIAERGYNHYVNNFSTKAIGKIVRELIEE